MVNMGRHHDDGDAGHHGSRVALVLQGGGALGAYHIGAYQAMEEAGYSPDWVAGTSIGAINSAVIVGNRTEDRLAKLEELWMEISLPNEWGSFLSGTPRRMFNEMSAATAIMFGQPNFWMPRFPSPLMLPEVPPEAASFCDTSPMHATLERLVDFDLINSGPIRISLGVTKVRTGEMVFFSNRNPVQYIGPEHVLASGSLPPGFPATLVDGDWYWDGGCVSNTPLDAIYHDNYPGHTLIFMIDLWSAMGDVPRNMDQVNWRQKQIQYASRTTRAIQDRAKKHNLRRALKMAEQRLPGDMQIAAAAADIPAVQIEQTFDIVHIIYHPTSDQIAESDAEFSRPSILARWEAGYRDLKAALKQTPLKHRKRTEPLGTMVHRVQAGEVQTMAFH